MSTAVLWLYTVKKKTKQFLQKTHASSLFYRLRKQDLWKNVK